MIRFTLGIGLVALCGASLVTAAPQKPFSLDRYQTIWGTDAFALSPKAVEPQPLRRNESSGEWVVSGVFSLDGEVGAIVTNTQSNAVEQISQGRESASGIELLHVLSSAAGERPRVEVAINGEPQVLTSAAKEAAK
ncbi:MAG: hypothetical protein AAF226_04790 [Verrucomicrobiota bacterium]